MNSLLTKTLYCDKLDIQHQLNKMITVQFNDSKWTRKLNIRSTYSNCLKEQQHCCCRTVLDKWFSSLLLLLIISISKSKHNVSITDIFTTCLQMILLMNNVLFKKYFEILKLMNKKLIIFSVKFTLFTSFRKFSLMRLT